MGGHEASGAGQHKFEEPGLEEFKVNLPVRNPHRLCLKIDVKTLGSPADPGYPMLIFHE